MEYFSLKGFNLINEIIEGRENNGFPDLRVDVNGESFFLREKPEDGISLIVQDCSPNSVITFSLHQNETAIPMVLNPLEHMSLEFAIWIKSKLASNLISIQITDNCTLSYTEFSELVNSRKNTQKVFFEQYYSEPKITADPLL